MIPGDRSCPPKPEAGSHTGPAAEHAPPVPDAGDVREAESATLSQWQLIRRRFQRHRIAALSLQIIVVLYTVALFAEMVAPYPKDFSRPEAIYHPPQFPRFSLSHGLHVPRLERQTHPIDLSKFYLLREDRHVPLGFLVRGEPYRLWGLIPMERHLFGVDLAEYHRAHPESSGTGPPVFMFLGGDRYGRDLFSRLIHGARISLSIGLVAIVFTFIFGITLGGISGYVGGHTDVVIQRIIEIINSFPHIPLWLAVAAILPSHWSPLQVYFAITIVLSLLNWTGLARVVRGKILALREEDYAVAAQLLGASHGRILFRHLVPGFTSHIIVVLTLSVPGMILGETALSFLGLGLRPPVVSWGVLMQDCLNLQVLNAYPWILMPVVITVITVLAFNFLGDGLRDAADPYSGR